MNGFKKAHRLNALIPLLFLLIATGCDNTWTQEEVNVIRTIDVFFHALAQKDTALAKKVMMPQGRFYSIREDGSIRTQSHEEFFASLANEQTDFLERMWNPTILIHDHIAVLWTPYDFHRDGRFSHCGVDAFSLIKTDKGWKITGTIYTVQRERCPETPLGSITK